MKQEIVNKQNLVGLIVIMVSMIAVLAVVIFGVPKFFGPVVAEEVQIGLVVVFALASLIVLLTVMAVVFNILRSANSKETLGLPEGSVRALIALLLLMIFIIMTVYLFRRVADGEGVNDAAQQLALQMVTLLGTLVTAVSAFYFGSQTANPSTNTAETTPKIVALSVDSITPASAPAASGEVKTEIIGSGFVVGAQVKLRLTGSPDVDATNVTVVDASKITCTFNLSSNQTGRWDVAVINPDGRQAGTNGLFQIT